MIYIIPKLDAMRSELTRLACLSGTNPAGTVTKGTADINCGAGAAPNCALGSGVASAGSCANGPADAKAFFIAPAQCNNGTRFSNSGSDCDLGSAPHIG